MSKAKKESILKAAEFLFSTKGFQETKVSDIAKESGVNEASIYAYFKNKKNIMFANSGRYVEAVVEGLAEHFLGMKESGPMLRKAIWHYLADIRDNPDYARLLMMTQRDPDFYASKYDYYLKEFSKLVLNVVLSGQKEGFFRTDISARLIRNMAMGTCVFTGIDYVVFDHDFDPNEMSDTIYRMVIRATMAESASVLEEGEKLKRNERAKYRKTQILETALRVFSEKGFSNTTISDIAKQANLGDATLYEYFENKEAILFAISGVMMKKLASDRGPYLENSEDPEQVLRKIIWQLIWQIYSHVDFSRLLVLDLLRNVTYYSTPGYRPLRVFQKKLIKTIEQGREKGVFSKDFPSTLYPNMVIGTFDQFLLGQFVLGRSPLGLSELNDIVDALVRAVKPSIASYVPNQFFASFTANSKK